MTSTTSTSADALLDRGRRFRALHEQSVPFVVPNPWDAGSARLLAGAGFAALATTSAGLAASVGVPDGAVGRDDTIRHVATIAGATDLPVTADLEDGYDDAPDAVAAVIAAAAAAGAVGGSIEDLRGRGADLFPLGLAVERVAAAVEAARALPFDFVLTARCEQPVVDDDALRMVIERLLAYQEAGADVLYAPGVRTAAHIHAIVSSVDRPVNVVMGLGGFTLPLTELAELGVRRVSVGSAMARAAYGALLRAADEIRDDGTFGFAGDAVPYARLNDLLREWPAMSETRE
ncbi:MAG: isocitrate lyase/phosphoenolpyruvate mutase family protein [Actinomycetota bacterium]|nr:isocitrate lyase/phosphoenolpyruvate mutase family protein [Actinomycetota bacterium]